MGLCLAERAKLTTGELPRLVKDAHELRKEIDRLVLALATTDEKPDAIVVAVAERQERLAALDAQIRAAKAAPEAINFELHRMEAEAKKRIADLQGMLERNPDEARQVLDAIFDGPLTFTAIDTEDGNRFRIEGMASVGKMLVEGGINRGVSKSASPAGFYPLVNLENSGDSGSSTGLSPWVVRLELVA